MLNIADTLHTWCRQSRPIALAIVVHVSAPLPPGTALAINTDGMAVGSISGGCVEGAVSTTCGNRCFTTVVRSHVPGSATPPTTPSPSA
ncbi:XdhC family protein [Nonomuraea sp. 3N208]|uniref:XdhC family protein n=1 Tax=Nonomuraea sp. 3N208 TaxID=3457421 RepID=UPI003FD028E3